jgi:hypothetical protein
MEETKPRETVKSNNRKNRLGRHSFAVAMTSCILGMGNVLYEGFIRPDEPEIVGRYKQVQGIIGDFKGISDGKYSSNSGERDFFYVDTEDAYIQQRLNSMKQSCSNESELAIGHLEKELEEIKSMEEFNEEFPKEQRRDKHYGARNLGAMLGIVVGGAGLFFSMLKKHTQVLS